MTSLSYNLGDENCSIADKLGNFYASPFVIDDVECGSVEGFIQALKFSDIEKQRKVARLVGKKAKFAGKKAGRRIAREGTVFWLGHVIPFRSDEHLRLIERAICVKFQTCPECKEALLSTGEAILVHVTSRGESRFTSLRAEDFISIILMIRNDPNLSRMSGVPPT